MADFSETVRAQLAQLDLGNGSVSRSVEALQVQSPSRPAQGTIAGQIIGAQQCKRSDTADGVMHCNVNHVALATLTDYIADLKKKNGKAPEIVTVSFSQGKDAAGIELPSELQAFPTSRLEALSQELQIRSVDKNYPVVISTDVQGMQSFADRGTPSGIILLSPRVLSTQPASTIVDYISGDIEKAKKAQGLGLGRT